MSMAENSECRGQKGNLTKNQAESDTKHLIRRPDLNAENVIFLTHDEGASILGEKYNTWNHCRSKKKGNHRMLQKDIKTVTGLSVNILKQLQTIKRNAHQ